MPARRLSSLLLLLLILFASACDPPKEKPEIGTKQTIVIGLLLCMTEQTPFFQSLVTGARDSAAKLDARLIVQYAHDDPQLQCSQIRSSVSERVSALLINPVSDAVVPELEKARDAGIAVFTIDRSIPQGPIVSHIASDNRAGGKMAGECLAEALRRKGLVVELEGTPGSSAARDRGEGFNKAIAAYADIKLVARQPAQFDRPTAQAVFSRLLSEHPRIDGVFAHNDDMIIGAIAAAKEAGRSNEIVFVGFDAIENAINSLEKGELHATIAQRPAEMGRLAVETVMKYVNGETVAPFIPVDLALIVR